MSVTADAHAMVDEQTLATIAALMQQETKYYTCRDYCKIFKGSQHCHSLVEDRKLMLTWSYNVLDFFNLERETAAIALSYSDRFLQSKKRGLEYLEDTEKYQLLCIVSLYVAIKVHEPASLTPQAFVEISRGQYTVDEMEQMEHTLLDTLEWHINPPTALEFVRSYLDLIPLSHLDRGMKAGAYLLSRAQTERALGNYNLISVDASKVAFASVQNAMEALGHRNSNILYDVASRIQRDCFQFELDELRQCLYWAITWEASKIQVAMGDKCPQGTSFGKGTRGKQSHSNQLETTTPRSVACNAFAS